MRRSLVVLVCFAVLVGACRSTTASPSEALARPTTTSTTDASTTTTTSTPSTTSTTVPATTTTTEPLPAVGDLTAWDGLEARLTVPLDHDDPDGPTLQVPVWRRPAVDAERRIGVVLVNPGGPGLPGRFLVQDPNAFTSVLQERFDIVALDPRGTYPSSEVNCLADLAEYQLSVDWTPDAPGELAALEDAVQGFVDDCAAENRDLLDHVSTMDTVHDMAVLVEALGEETVSYLGYSYGTVLGAAFRATYPELVRVTVLDGAYEPFGYGDLLNQAITEIAAVDEFLVRLFEECDTSSDCPIADGAQAAFVRVSAAADAGPLSDSRFYPPMNQEAFATTIQLDPAIYGGSPQRLLEAVAEADGGDSGKLQLLYSEALDFLEFGGSNLAIRCLDYPYRGLSPVPDDALDRVRAAGPTLELVFPTPPGFDPFAVEGECERWPVGPELLPDAFSVENGTPVLVVTSTGDPVTPADSAVDLADRIDNSTLLVAEHDEHTSYRTARNAGAALTCATDYIDQFLISLEPPPVGTVCAEDATP